MARNKEPDLAALSMPELEALAVELKNEEQTMLAEIRGRKLTVRDEIMRRARRDYAEQKLRGIGIEPTEALIEGIIAQSVKVADSGVVVTPETYRGTLEAE